MASNTEQVEQLRWQKFPVLDDGFVCLVDVMGDDGSVVQAARVSYGEGTKRVSDDRTLVRYLMRHRHSTPFEMAEVKLLVMFHHDPDRSDSDLDEIQIENEKYLKSHRAPARSVCAAEGMSITLTKPILGGETHIEIE